MVFLLGNILIQYQIIFRVFVGYVELYFYKIISPLKFLQMSPIYTREIFFTP